MKKNNIIAYDLFCGAGGMSLGAVMAGIKMRLAIDADLAAVQTYKYNHKEVEVIHRNIKNIDAKKYKTNQPLIISGGPPCQGYSISNKRTRSLNNKKNSLFNDFVRFVKVIQPDWFVFENVEGIKSFNNGKTVEEIIDSFEKLGYKTKHKVLTAVDYGVPQNRNRFFLVGNKLDIEFKFPKPSHTKKITVWEAIYDLPVLENGAMYKELSYKTNELNDYTTLMRTNSNKAKQNYVSKNKDYVIERYSYIKPGQNWMAIPDHLMKNYKNKNNCHSGIYKRLEKDKPSVVIANYRKNMLIHPEQDRGLSLREAARLQSFLDDFLFIGNISSTQQQIGNAVPPLLAKAIYNKILSYY